MHNGDQDGILPDGLRHFLGIHPPIVVYPDKGYLKTPLLQEFAGIIDRVVLDAGGDDVFSLTFICPSHSLQGKIVRLGSPRSEIDLLGLSSKDRSHLFPRLFHGPLRFPS